VGYVEVEGTPATVRDSANGATVPVTDDGYFVLAERTPWVTNPPAHNAAGKQPTRSLCVGCDINDLQVLNAAGQELKPDYTWGGMLPGYAVGPTP
ncbi:MAG TPA: hypothetical protein VME01_08985, partial [Solirubrobacteraceae bacterium]|nr:hypothetical protein [Solirubrobacteraceae bacterium]